MGFSERSETGNPANEPFGEVKWPKMKVDLEIPVWSMAGSYLLLLLQLGGFCSHPGFSETPPSKITNKMKNLIYTSFYITLGLYKTHKNNLESVRQVSWQFTFWMSHFGKFEKWESPAFNLPLLAPLMLRQQDLLGFSGNLKKQRLVGRVAGLGSL